MYLATNLGHSPKAVRKACGPRKHCSHLDIHKTSMPVAITGFIRIPQQREENGVKEEEQRGLTGRKKTRGRLDVKAHWGIYAISYYPLPMKI